MPTLDEYRERVKEHAADSAAYAERIKVELLYGYKKPTFFGDVFLEGCEAPALRAPEKCGSCGSREFTLHHARHICSYCRQ